MFCRAVRCRANRENAAPRESVRQRCIGESGAVDGKSARLEGGSGGAVCKIMLCVCSEFWVKLPGNLCYCGSET